MTFGTRITAAMLRRRVMASSAKQLRASDAMARVAATLAVRGKVPKSKIPADVLAKFKGKIHGL